MEGELNNGKENMNNIRDKVEGYFRSLGLGVYQYRYLSLAFVVALTGFLLLQLANLTVDTSNDAFYREDDPIRVEYNEFRRQFGKDDHIIIGLESAEIFSSSFLQTLEQIQAEIDDKVPYLNKVTSLLNVRYTYGLDDELIVEDFIESIPQSTNELMALKQKAIKNPYYQNYLLSKDGRFTFIDIEPVAIKAASSADKEQIVNAKFVSTAEYGEMLDALQPILEKYRSSNLKIYAAGFPVISDSLTKAIEQTMAELMPISMLVNMVFLLVLFRRLSGVIYPSIVVLLSMASTVGAMAWLSISLDLVTSILPSLLIVVSVADSVHLLSGFYQEYDNNGGDKKAAIAHSMGQNSLAILMTSLTTAVGFASFILADMAPVAHLGVVAPIGIALAFIYTVLLLPALIAIFPVRKKNVSSKATGYTNKILDWIADVSCSSYKSILFGSFVLLLIGILGASQLRLSHNALKWFPQDSQVRVDTTMIDTAIGGSIPIEVTIDTGKKLGLYNPDLVSRLAVSAETVKGMSSGSVGIADIISLHTILKEVNKALHANNDADYTIPDSRELIAQELLLFEISGADDLYKLVDSDYSKVRFTIIIPFTDAIQIKPVLEKIKTHFVLTYPDATISITGIAPMLVETMYDVLTSMLKSYSIALLAITFLMIALLGKLKIGIISMVPNILPIILVMGVMGWMGLPFDFSNMLVGSIAIGLVVDDTIHFLHNLRRHYDRTGDIDVAVRATLHSTGRAIFITSMVLASGMVVAMTAYLSSTANFGIIIAIVIVVALLADYFLVPALMYALFKKSSSQSSNGAVNSL
ncbi:MAG: MMPL family transporter [Candidatus Thiodiazotropha sp.]